MPSRYRFTRAFPWLSVLRVNEMPNLTGVSASPLNSDRDDALNDAISSGVGGRPCKSNVRRRIMVRRSASGRGRRPLDSRAASRKTSIGFRDHLPSITAGSGDLASGRMAHQSDFGGFRVIPSGQWAPCSIHRRRSATSAVESGLPPRGISGFSPEIFSMSRLDFGSPGTTASPSSPPLRRPSAVAIERPPLATFSPWQERQRASRSGAIRSRKESSSAPSRARAARRAAGFKGDVPRGGWGDPPGTIEALHRSQPNLAA